ncbi:MAG TPA: glycosyltransferase [Longimicrobiales bacterium]|nr:glycosyltransferase [Longimicrobiales bacterium]
MTGPDPGASPSADAPPRVSVVMAVFDGEKYVAESVASILAQDFPDFELIIIDDGSTDGTRDIVAAFDDPRIVLHANPANIGLAASLNRGLGVARGEFIARQDADDVSAPTRLARQVEFMDAHPDIGLLGTAHTEIDDAGAVVGDVDAHADHAMIAWSLLFFCPFVHSSVMFRRSVVDGVGAYDPAWRYSLDFEYWTRIARRYRVANLPERLVRLRFHVDSMTSTYGERTLEGHRLRVRNVARLLGMDGRPDAEQEAVHARIARLMFGPWTGLDAGDALTTVDEVLHLQTAFVRDAGLQRDEAAAHRFELRRHLGRALLEFGRSTPAPSAAPRLAWRIAGLTGRDMLRPRTLAALADLLLRGTLLQPVARAAGRFRRGRHGDRTGA